MNTITHKKEYKVGLPELPTQSEFNTYLSAIWSEKIVTNFGPIHNSLEENLSKYLEVDNVVLFASGTSALEALLSMYNTSSRVVMPSFSFDATLTAVRRNNLQLGFVDVNVSDGTFDTKSLRARPSSMNSDLLLGVHCYGFPCNVSEMQELNLPTIFDAAHSMGSKLDGKHLATYGDASVLSLHATKIFSAVEGGAVITSDENLAHELRKYRYFGIDRGNHSEMHSGRGTNSKMSELHAAMGLLQLKKFEEILYRRKEIFLEYRKKLCGFTGLRLMQPSHEESINGSYVPVFVDALKVKREKLMDFLRNEGIFTKPYFDKNLALLADNQKYEGCFSNTDLLAKSVMCLPIHSEMTFHDVGYICGKIEKFLSEYDYEE